jgi:Glycosyltransferase family 9 (heptosyltransferase)
VFVSIVLIRQRPAIGDALLLGPLIREIKKNHPKHTLTVLTDDTYAKGALTTIFQGIKGVDRIELVPMRKWTTEDNVREDHELLGVDTINVPSIVRKAAVFNCNTAFIEHERAGGNQYGIAEFWLRHFGFWQDDIDCKPTFEVPERSDSFVKTWLQPEGKKVLGIVLRPGDPVRKWDYDDRATTLMNWASDRGYHPVSIDGSLRTNSVRGQAWYGQRIDDTAALLKACDLVFTPDTGLLHLAEAVGTPTISLWGKVHPDLRVKGYKTMRLGVEGPPCPPEEKCPSCTWTFQHYGCVRKIGLQDMTSAVERCMDFI